MLPKILIQRRKLDSSPAEQSSNAHSSSPILGISSCPTGRRALSLLPSFSYFLRAHFKLVRLVRVRPSAQNLCLTQISKSCIPTKTSKTPSFSKRLEAKNLLYGHSACFSLSRRWEHSKYARELREQLGEWIFIEDGRLRAIQSAQ